MKKFRSHFNYKTTDDEQYEHIDKKSLTVVGEVLPVKELLNRALNGMDVQRHPPTYLDAGDLDKIGDHYRPIVDLTDVDKVTRETEALQLQIDKFKEEQERLKQEQEENDKQDDPVSDTPEPE